MTPLHWAVEQEHMEVMILLLENGADPHSISKFNKSPITIAFEHDRLDFAELLQRGQGITSDEKCVPLEESGKKNQKDHEEVEKDIQNLSNTEAEHQKQEKTYMQIEDEQQKKKVTPGNKTNLVYQ